MIVALILVVVFLSFVAWLEGWWIQQLQRDNRELVAQRVCASNIAIGLLDDRLRELGQEEEPEPVRHLSVVPDE